MYLTAAGLYHRICIPAMICRIYFFVAIIAQLSIGLIFSAFSVDVSRKALPVFSIDESTPPCEGSIELCVGMCGEGICNGLLPFVQHATGHDSLIEMVSS